MFSLRKNESKDEMGVDEMGVDEMGVDELRVDAMGVDEMGVDELGVDEMGVSRKLKVDQMGRHRIYFMSRQNMLTNLYI